MYKRLRRNFIVLCAGLTGIVLFVALLFSYLLSISQLQAQIESVNAYQNQMVEHSLLKEDHIDHAIVREYERDFDMLIFLYDNGSYIDIADGENHDEKNGLRTLAEEEAGRLFAIAEISDFIPIAYASRDIEVIGNDGTQYAGRVVFSPVSVGSWYGLIMLRQSTYLYEETQLLFWRHVLLFVGLMVVLVVVSWFLARRSVKPAEIAQREQKEFIAAASHELKSPLAVISASAEYLQRDKELSAFPQANIHLDAICDEAKHMARLVDDLLLLSHIEASGLLLKKAVANTEGLLIAAYDRCTVLAQKSNHPMRLELPDEPLPSIEVDADRVLQMILIFISNAIEHTSTGTAIEIVGRNDNKQVIISVVDHGKGISDEDKRKIFNRFYQGDKSHNSKNNFGIGLSVAAELARLHGTSIQVLDTNGGGATFLFCIPIH